MPVCAVAELHACHQASCDSVSLQGQIEVLRCLDAQGWVETTYVDEEVRVGRGDKGSVFVTVRQQDKKRK